MHCSSTAKGEANQRDPQLQVGSLFSPQLYKGVRSLLLQLQSLGGLQRWNIPGIWRKFYPCSPSAVPQFQGQNHLLKSKIRLYPTYFDPLNTMPPIRKPRKVKNMPKNDHLCSFYAKIKTLNTVKIYTYPHLFSAAEHDSGNEKRLGSPEHAKIG